jgi:hypothetical protein
MTLLHQHVGSKTLDLLNMNHLLIMHTIWKELPYKTAWAMQNPICTLAKWQCKDSTARDNAILEITA